jgi:hypothetical protein
MGGDFSTAACRPPSASGTKTRDFRSSGGFLQIEENFFNLHEPPIMAA